MKFSVSLCSFTCLLLRSVCDTGNSSQQTSLQCLSTNNMAFSDEDKILIKYINTLSIHSYGRSGIIMCALKMQFVRIVSISAEYLQKIWIFDIPGWVATCLRWGGCCCMGFVANFTSFTAVQKFWKSVKYWQSYREFKGGNFFWDTVHSTNCTISILTCIQKLRYKYSQLSLYTTRHSNGSNHVYTKRF